MAGLASNAADAVSHRPCRRLGLTAGVNAWRKSTAPAQHLAHQRQVAEEPGLSRVLATINHQCPHHIADHGIVRETPLS